MKNAQFWRGRAVRHGVGWAVISAATWALGGTGDLPTARVLGVPYTVVSLVVPALAVYAHYWLLMHLLEGQRRRVGWYLLGLVLVLSLGAGLFDQASRYAGLSYVQMKPKAATPDARNAYRVGQAMGNIVFVLLLSTVARYVRRGIISHLQVQQLRALQLETELSLLKAQVNQHFLFNTLNNLYGLSLAAPEQMPEALLQLAGLMRYQLDSSRQAAVTVGTEAEYLANYIGLEKLRLRANTQVEFTADLPHPDRPLAPLLLLPLVENCFKHAIGPSGENHIRIHLNQTDAGLTLHTDNSVPPQFRAPPSGLGLPTLRARLAQYYPGNRHRLAIEATPERYVATLQLVL